MPDHDHDHDLCILTTTVAERDDAERLAHDMVERRLAACAQISALSSVYRWQGAVQQEAEWRIDFKTVRARMADLQAALAAVHPYELPELCVQVPEQVSAAYLAWVRQGCEAP